MFLDMFKEELIFLDNQYIDDEIFQKILNKVPEIENIIPILNKSENYVS